MPPILDHPPDAGSTEAAGAFRSARMYSCRASALDVCSSCARRVLAVCSSCARHVLVVCSMCARRVLVVCSSCARRVLDVCSTCARRRSLRTARSQSQARRLLLLVAPILAQPTNLQYQHVRSNLGRRGTQVAKKPAGGEGAPRRLPKRLPGAEGPPEGTAGRRP